MLDSDARKECREMGRELARWYECPVYITELEYGDPDDLEPEELLENLLKSPRAKQGSNKSQRVPIGRPRRD
jgi:hypothetical protein